MTHGPNIFDNDRWIETFKEIGMDPDFYTMRERSLDEVFPWDFIDAGVTKEFYEPRVEDRNGGESHAKLPDAVFRLRRYEL